MKLSATSGTSPEPIEVEVTKIVANRMERRRLLAEKVLDTSQDEVYCLAGFTYSQQIAEKAIAAKERKPLKRWCLRSIETLLKSFQKKSPNAFQITSRGIMLSTWNQMQ